MYCRFDFLIWVSCEAVSVCDYVLAMNKSLLNLGKLFFCFKP